MQGIWKLHQEGQSKYEEGYKKGKAEAYDEIKEWFETQGNANGFKNVSS